MNPEKQRLRRQEQNVSNQTNVESTAKTQSFASVEELLRHDASLVDPPATIEAKLKDSLAHQVPPQAPFWRRWFGSH